MTAQRGGFLIYKGVEMTQFKFYGLAIGPLNFADEANRRAAEAHEAAIEINQQRRLIEAAEVTPDASSLGERITAETTRVEAVQPTQETEPAPNAGYLWR